MDKVFEAIASFNGVINEFVWVRVGLIMLLGTGLLMTVVTKVFQVGHFGHWWKNTIGSMFTKKVIGHTKDKGAISPFQALCTALAATIGTGNIAGVAAAICLGGPGAVFWMWVSAFFGMCTKYAEIALALKYRTTDGNGRYQGGGMLFAPGQDRDSGQLCCMVWHDTTALGTLLRFPFVIPGKHTGFPFCDMLTGHEITVELASPTMIQLDGEVIDGVTGYTAKK